MYSCGVRSRGSSQYTTPNGSVTSLRRPGRIGVHFPPQKSFGLPTNANAHSARSPQLPGRRAEAPRARATVAVIQWMSLQLSEKSLSSWPCHARLARRHPSTRGCRRPLQVPSPPQGGEGTPFTPAVPWLGGYTRRRKSLCFRPRDRARPYWGRRRRGRRPPTPRLCFWGRSGSNPRAPKPAG